MKIGYLTIAVILTILVLIMNYRLMIKLHFGKNVPEEGVICQANYLSEKLRQGAAEEMQGLFPEGFVFTNALFGLSCTEIARYSHISQVQKNRLIGDAKWALNEIESKTGKKTFQNNMNLCPMYGVFYSGWRNLLEASILRVNKDASQDEIAAFRNRCDELLECFSKQGHPFLESYNNSAWPADALTAIASMAIHDRIFTPRYECFINNWLKEAEKRMDSLTHLIPHSVFYETGKPDEGARGSSQSLIIRLLADIDGDFAKKQYGIFKQHFSTTFLGLPAIREYPKGRNGYGDIDSGPVVFGIGAAGTIVAIGTARAIGDEEMSDGITRFIEAIGFPIQIGQKKWYGFGAFPLGDAFLCWSKATLPIDDNGSQRASGMAFHFISAIFVLCLFSPYAVAQMKRKGHKDAERKDN